MRKERMPIDEWQKIKSDLRAKTAAKTLRDKALIDVMLYAGLRQFELASLTTGNFKQDGGRWWIVLRGKGNKTRRIKLHDALYKSLAAWLDYLNTQGGNTLTLGIDEIPIFYNLNKGGKLTGKKLNLSVINRIVSEYGYAAGLAPGMPWQLALLETF